MGICTSSSIFTLSDACIRSSWSTFIPAAVVLCLVLLRLLNSVAKNTGHLRWLGLQPMPQFLTLEEAEVSDSADNDSGVQSSGTIEHSAAGNMGYKRIHAYVLALLALVETLLWVSYGSYDIFLHSGHSSLADARSPVQVGAPIVLTFVWFYATLTSLPIAWSSNSNRPGTVPFDLVSIYVAYLVAAAINLSGILYDRMVQGLGGSEVESVVWAMSAKLCLSATFVAFRMPLKIPSHGVRAKAERNVRVFLPRNTICLCADRSE